MFMVSVCLFEQLPQVDPLQQAQKVQVVRRVPIHQSSSLRVVLLVQQIAGIVKVSISVITGGKCGVNFGRFALLKISLL